MKTVYYFKMTNKKPENHPGIILMVHQTRFELARASHTPLKRARLPVPPLVHISIIFCFCEKNKES